MLLLRFIQVRPHAVRAMGLAAGALGLGMWLASLSGCFMAAGVILSGLESPQKELVARSDFFAGSVTAVVRVLPERSHGGMGPGALVVGAFKGSRADEELARRGSSGKDKVVIVALGSLAHEGVIEVLASEVRVASLEVPAKPRRVALAPGQWVSFEPMIHESENNLEQLDVTLSLSVGGVSETRTLTLTRESAKPLEPSPR